MDQNNQTPATVTPVTTEAAPTPAPSSSPDTAAAVPTLPKNASAEDVLRFNPFAKGANAAPGPKTEPTPAAAPAQTPAAAASPASATPVGTPNQNPEVAAIHQLLAQGDGNTQPAPAAAPAAGDNADPFQVNWTIPNELMQGLFSGDPNLGAQSVSVMMNGIANGVLGTMKERLSELVQQFPAIVERTIAAREANQAFYNDFPHLKSPMLKETVARVAAATAQAWKNLGKQVDPNDPAFRDAVENFLVQQGLAQRPQGWKHPRVQIAPVPPSPPQPHFGSNVAPSHMNGQQPGSRNLMDEIGF